MFLKDMNNGDLVDVLDVSALMDPSVGEISVRSQSGEEVGDPMTASKERLLFPSGEVLPECWRNMHYRVNF
ncbi:MAG: acetyltransferase [Mariprofundaceae bacterium]|nr:acetyltransferase [Mariprofundaceae bacterium]